MGLFNKEKGISNEVLENKNVPENGQIIVRKKADVFLLVRGGGGRVRKCGGEDLMVRGGSNPDVYKDYIEC